MSRGVKAEIIGLVVHAIDRFAGWKTKAGVRKQTGMPITEQPST